MSLVPGPKGKDLALLSLRAGWGLAHLCWFGDGLAKSRRWYAPYPGAVKCPAVCRALQLLEGWLTAMMGKGSLSQAKCRYKIPTFWIIRRTSGVRMAWWVRYSSSALAGPSPPQKRRRGPRELVLKERLSPRAAR